MKLLRIWLTRYASRNVLKRNESTFPNATQPSVFAFKLCRGILIVLLIWSLNNYSFLCKYQNVVSLVFVHFLDEIHHPNESEISFYFVIKLKWKWWRTVLYEKQSYKSESINCKLMKYLMKKAKLNWIYTHIKVKQFPQGTQQFLMGIARMFWCATWQKTLVCACAGAGQVGMCRRRSFWYAQAHLTNTFILNDN